MVGANFRGMRRRQRRGRQQQRAHAASSPIASPSLPYEALLTASFLVMAPFVITSQSKSYASCSIPHSSLHCKARFLDRM
jgi:hypothetical protein